MDGLLERRKVNCEVCGRPNCIHAIDPWWICPYAEEEEDD